jgi:hypothetical protein
MGDDFYLDADIQATRDPDFSSSVGYDDWHPYTLSQVYANYKDNRLCHPKQAALSMASALRWHRHFPRWQSYVLSFWCWRLRPAERSVPHATGA